MSALYFLNDIKAKYRFLIMYILAVAYILIAALLCF